MSRALIISFSQFDLMASLNILARKFEISDCDLIVEKKIAPTLNELVGGELNIIASFDQKFVFRKIGSQLSNCLAIQDFVAQNHHQYDIIMVGAYRDALTSIFLKKVKIFENFYTFLQVKPGNESQYIVTPPMRYRLKSLFLRVFGYSDFHLTSFKQKYDHQSDYISSSIIWRDDPFLSANIMDVGDYLYSNVGQTTPPFDSKLIRHKVCVSRKRIFLIGERTPVLLEEQEKNESVYHHVFQVLKDSDYDVFLRPRPGMTSVGFYNDKINLIILDGQQLIDKQLLTVNPDYVISFKSTAIKTAAAYGFSCKLLYPLLNMGNDTRNHLDNMFANEANLLVKDIEELRKVIG